MGSPLMLTAVLEPRGRAAAVILTDDQVIGLGAGKTPPVSFTVNGITIAGRIGRMGGQNMLGFNKAVRTQLGVQAGDTIDIEIVLDDQPREVELPTALAEALAADPAAKATFDALAPSRRKEHARSVADAKTDATRDRRVAAVLQKLRDAVS